MYNSKEIKKILNKYIDQTGQKLFDKNLSTLISEIQPVLPCKSDLILSELWSVIKRTIKKYDKYETYYLTEYMREHYACRASSVPIYTLIEVNEIALLIQDLVMDNCLKWEFRKLDNKILDCLEQFKIYVLADINSKLIKEVNNENDLISLLNPNTEKNLNIFLDNAYIEQDMFSKLESSVIEDYCTKEYLRTNSMDLHSIKTELFDLLNMEIKFSYKEFRLFKKIIEDINNYYVENKFFTHFCLSFDEFYEWCFNSRLGKDPFYNIVSFFSLSRYNATCHPNARKMELLCFYVDDLDKIHFGSRNTLETLTIFENLLTSGHFNDEIGICVSNEILGRCNNKLSKYFSYYVADMLSKKGLIIPRTQSGEYYVEIEKVEGRNNIVSFNDVDVLAFDKKSKIIYNCELKYYKPRMNYKSMVQSTIKSKLKKQVLIREKLIVENKLLIGQELIGEDVSDYNVKSCIITSRPTMININSPDADVACYSIIDILNNRLV